MTKLGALVEQGELFFSDGYRTKKAELSDSGYVILRAADIVDNRVELEGVDHVDSRMARQIGSKVAKEGDVILTTKGTVGRTALVKDLDGRDAVYSPQVCYFRFPEGSVLVAQYLQYWFASSEGRRQIRMYSGNTDMAPYLSLRDIAELDVKIPRRSEQAAVCEVLGALDDKIAINLGAASKSRQVAVALVGEVAGSMKVGEVTTEVRKSVIPSSLGVEAVAHFSLPAFDAGAAALDAPADIKSAKNMLQEPVVLVSKLNPRIPRIWAVDRLPAELALASTEFVSLAPRGVGIGPLWAALLDPRFTSSLLERTAGTTGSHQRVKPEQMLDVDVPDVRQLAPGRKELLESLCRKVNDVADENLRLAATRDELLPLLMSGRITVKDAEKTVEEVV